MNWTGFKGACGFASLSLALLNCGVSAKKDSGVGSSNPGGTGTQPGSGSSATRPVSSGNLPATTGLDAGPLFAAKPPAVVVTARATASAAASMDASKAHYVTCSALAADGQAGAIDDLEDADLLILQNEKRSGSWFKFEETAGSHEMSVVPVQDGPHGSKYALHDVAKEHGEWAGFGVPMGECRYDAAKYTGVHFWAKGTAKDLRLALNNPGILPISEGGTCTKDTEGLCYDAHQATVTLDTSWKEYNIPFTGLLQAGWGLDVGPFQPKDLISVEFHLGGANFDIWIDDLGFYREGVPYYPATNSTSSVSTSAAASSSAPPATTNTATTAAPSTSVTASATASASSGVQIDGGAP